MTQKTFFPSFESAEQVNYRQTDPVTSKQASERYEHSGNAESDREAIVRVVTTQRLASGNGYLHGLTAGEIAHLLGDDWDNVRVSRRAVEVERKGKIRRGMVRRCSIKGSEMVTWHPVE